MEILNNTLGLIASIIAILAAVTAASVFVRKNKTKIKGGGFYNKVGGNSKSVNQSSLSGASGVVIIGDNNVIHKSAANPEQDKENVALLKAQCQILFIDDEDFNVIKMLEKAGWKNIKKVSDIVDFDCLDLRNADIVFVDIKGVGLELGFKNEGIGLAAEIKKRYPKKGVVIYSATPEHPLFDPDIDNVDDRLSKNAEPIEFQNMIEQYGRKH